MIELYDYIIKAGKKSIGEFYRGFFICDGCGVQTDILEFEFNTHAVNLCADCLRAVAQLMDDQEPIVEELVGVTSFARFLLKREQDVSGVSGTGIVAEGIQFTDRTVVLRWLGKTASTVIWDTLEDAMKVHGHDGRTIVVWVEDTDAATSV